MALVRVELRPGVVFLYTQEEADNVVAANPDAKIVSSPGEKAVESAPATKERAKASNKTTTPATTSDEP